MKNRLFKYSKTDFLGILSAMTCFIHCNIAVIFFVMGFHINESTCEYKWLDYGFLLISFWAVFNAMNTSLSPIIPRFMLISFILLAFGVLFHDDFNFAKYIAGLGSLALMIVHGWNIRYCSICQRDKYV